VTALACAAILAAPSAGAASCATSQVKVATGCVTRTAASRHIADIVRKAMPKLGVRATIIRVDTGGRELLSRGFGSSMAGVPASPRMHFRIGSMAIPYIITLLLQLEDKGVLSLNDKLSKYLPRLPNANEVTLRELASVTSGYPDWIQENEAFQNVLLKNPFRQWTPNELLAYAFALPPVCAPGTCFHYAHTNFAVLSEVISKATGKSVSSLVQKRVLKPLGLDQIQVSRYPAMPGPVLHSYTSERGVYEDATFWSPSWSIGAGTVMTGTIGDVTRTARAIGTGALLSRHVSRERFAPITAHLAPFNSRLYYALGILLDNGWQLQNPVIDGYTGIMAYLPSRRISVGLVTTQLPQSSANATSYASLIFKLVSAYLSPAHEAEFPGS
jgi:D-alanyl-D-alanine carboxypeptidase